MKTRKFHNYPDGKGDNSLWGSEKRSQAEQNICYVCRRQQWFLLFICLYFFFFFLMFSSAHWLLWRQSGWKKRSWRLGLWAPSETPLLSHYNANEMDLFLWGRVCCRATKLQPPCKHQWGVHHKLSSYQFSKMANLNRCNSGLNDFSLSWGLFQFVLVVSLWPLSVSV